MQRATNCAGRKLALSKRAAALQRRARCDLRFEDGAAHEKHPQSKPRIISEARNALARAVFFKRLGEIRGFEQQRHRASGLNLVTAAIVPWNTVYLERALRRHDQKLDEALCKHLSPLGWEHINLTGDYGWKDRQVGSGKYRPPRPLQMS